MSYPPRFLLISHPTCYIQTMTRLSINDMLNPEGDPCPTNDDPEPSNTSTSISSGPVPPLCVATQPPKHIDRNVRLNRKTILASLCHYKVGTLVDYPETHQDGFGHLFDLDLKNWSDPTSAFAYSMGNPSGSRDGTCELLKGEDGVNVPCRVYHYTCT